MNRFTAMRYDDLSVGPLAQVAQELTPSLVSQWRSLMGYELGDTAPSSLALTWLLGALREALDGIPAGGVLLRHELTFHQAAPMPPTMVTSRVAVAELVEHKGRSVVVFDLDSAIDDTTSVTNRMYLIWPSTETAAPAARGQPPTVRMAPQDAHEVLLHTSIGQDDIDAYATLSGDHNPLHVDVEAGLRSPFGSTIAHGPLPLGFVQRALESRVGAEWPTGLRLDARFLGPTRPGDTVEVQLTSDGIYRLVDDVGRLLIQVHVERQD